MGKHAAMLERLMRDKAAQDAAQRADAAAVVSRIGETVRRQHGRRTLEHIVRDSGFAESSPGDLDAVVRLNDGRVFR